MSHPILNQHSIVKKVKDKLSSICTAAKTKSLIINRRKEKEEVAGGFEPPYKVLQTSA